MFNSKQKAYLLDRLGVIYPEAAISSLEVAIAGFSEYCELVKEYKEVPMFSKSVDAVWHALILDTKEYAIFSKETFGYFLHHTPSDKGARDIEKDNEALCLLWLRSCKNKRIDPFDRLCSETPALFLADILLEKDSISPLRIIRKLQEDLRAANEKDKSLTRIFRAKDKSAYSTALREDYNTKAQPDPYYAISIATMDSGASSSPSNNHKSENHSSHSHSNDSHSTSHSSSSSSSHHTCSSSSHSCSSSSCGSSCSS